MPVSFAKDSGLTDISDICRLGDGKRLVSIIAVASLFNNSAVKEALHAMSDVDGNTDEDVVEHDLDDDEQVVVFRLGHEEFGVPIATVQEIVRIPDELIHVPTAPEFVEGLINLRGSVLPVVDLRRRLGLVRIERSDGQRIMVFLINKIRTGFIVDQVVEVLKIPKFSIEAAPNFSSEQMSLLSRMANMAKAKRMVQLLDPAYLVRDDKVDTLTALAA
jgi:purine-binding chemotaxis protein CheW